MKKKKTFIKNIKGSLLDNSINTGGDSKIEKIIRKEKPKKKIN